MSVIGSPTNRSPQRAFALQKYLILHSQHDALQKHLNSLTSTSTSASPLSSTESSPISSPEKHFRHHHRASITTITPIPEDVGVAPMPRPVLQQRRSSLPTDLEAPSLSREQSEILEEEQKLFNINQQIKSVLTELLNCESVRNDKQYRTWVQSRLMDAEMELKCGKAASVGRRKSIDFAV